MQSDVHLCKDLAYHRRVHDTGERFPFDACGTGLVPQKLLKHIKRRIHWGETILLRCLQEPILFCRRFLKPMNAYIPVKKPYSCDHCDKKFVSPGRCKQHKRWHTADKKLTL